MLKTLEDILNAKSDDLTDLAKIAGYAPLEFYTYVDLRSLDLEKRDALAMIHKLETLVQISQPKPELRAFWEERIATYKHHFLGTESKSLKPAHENFFYCLATIYGEQPKATSWSRYDKRLADQNRNFWNRWWYARLQEGAIPVNEEERISAVKAFSIKDREPLSEKEKAAYHKILLRFSEPDNLDTPTNLDTIDLSYLRFERLLAFAGFVFIPHCSFDKSIAEQDVNFSKTHFRQSANFNATRFKGYADFKKASFRGTTFFQNTRFRGETQIQTKNPNNTKSSQGTSFHLFASFREASLSGYAALRKSSNARNTPSFPKARFKRDADFRGATFTQTIPQSLTPYL